MKMKLFSSPASPYARKVRVVAHELGLADQVDEIHVNPLEAPAELLAANPLSRIPTLITEKGEALPDSGLIVEYLMTRGSGLAPVPRGVKRWGALRRAEIADGMTVAAVAYVFERRRPESIVYTQYLDRQTAVIRRAVAWLDVEAMALKLDVPGVIEIAVATGLSYLDFRMPFLEWRAGHDALANWHRAFCERPSMQATQHPSK